MNLSSILCASFVAMTAFTLTMDGMPALAQMRPAGNDAEQSQRPIQEVAPMRQMTVTRPALTPVETTGAIVRVTPTMRSEQILSLRDDQMIETPSGNRMNVGMFRRLQTMFANARSRSQQRRETRLAFQRAPAIQGTPRRPGENLTQLLARPPSDALLLPSGHSVSVAQLKVIANYLQQHGKLNMRAMSAARPNLSGPATRIATIAQLKALPKNPPDSMVLESPKGTRITVGELREVLGAQRRMHRPILAPRGGQQ